MRYRPGAEKKSRGMLLLPGVDRNGEVSGLSVAPRGSPKLPIVDHPSCPIRPSENMSEDFVSSKLGTKE